MAIFNARARAAGHRLRPALAAVALLALSGCVVEPAGYYGGAPAYPAYAAAYPAYGYYAAPPVGVVVGGGWGGWGGGWGRGWGGWRR
jgi:hypothetical protein